jgi:hypothetical protein
MEERKRRRRRRRRRRKKNSNNNNNSITQKHNFQSQTRYLFSVKILFMVKYHACIIGDAIKNINYFHIIYIALINDSLTKWKRNFREKEREITPNKKTNQNP